MIVNVKVTSFEQAPDCYKSLTPTSRNLSSIRMHNLTSRPSSRNRESFVPNVLRSLEATLHRDDHLQN
jgi:hypothetical protein